MSTPSFNWQDLQQAADDAGFVVLPVLKRVGAEVATAEAATTGTGKPQIKVRFVLTEGPYAGKSVFNNFVLTLDNGTALGFFFRQMEALGLNRTYFDANPPLTQVAAAIVKRPCLLDIGVRQWQGTDRNNVEALYPPEGGASATPAPAPGGYVPAPGMVPATSVGVPVPTPAVPTPTVPTPTPAVPTPAPLPVPPPTEAPAPVDVAPPDLPF